MTAVLPGHQQDFWSSHILCFDLSPEFYREFKNTVHSDVFLVSVNNRCVYPCELEFDPPPQDYQRITSEELHLARSYTIKPVNWARRTPEFTCRYLVKIELSGCGRQEFGWSAIASWEVLWLLSIRQSEDPGPRAIATHNGTARILTGNRFWREEQRIWLEGLGGSLSISSGSPPQYRIRLQPALSPIEEDPRNEVAWWLLRNVRIPLPVPSLVPTPVPAPDQ